MVEGAEVVEGASGMGERVGGASVAVDEAGVGGSRGGTPPPPSSYGVRPF